MKRMLFLLSFVAAITAWCPASFAQRQAAVGPGLIPLDATGVLNGVDMTGSLGTGTLTVGVPGGPTMDILTSNSSPFVAGLVAVSTDASSTSNITFNSGSTVFGNIGVTQPGGPFFLNINAGAAATTVTFRGSVFATTLNVTGTGVVNFNSGATNITATNFAGDGTISLATNTTVIGALTTTAGANTGTLSLGGGSVLDGAVGGAIGLRAINVVGGTNAAGVTARITGAANAFTFNLGTNTLNVDGALTIANLGASGVINTTLASSSVFGNIRPVGATNLGPTLSVVVTVPATTVLTVGTLFNIVQTRTGTLQSGTNGSVVAVTSPSNPLYTFSAVPPAGTIAGLVTIRVDGIPLLVPIAPPPGAVLPPVVPIAAVVVPVLVAIPATPDLIPVLAAINALSDPAAVVDAEAQLAPSTPDLVAALVTFQGARQFQNLWLSRLDDVRCGQVSQRDEDTSTCRGDERQRGGWWLKGFGYFGNQETRGAYYGYDSRILGTMIAYDVPLGRETRAGVGVGYARSRIDGKTFDTGTDVDTYQGTAYIGYEPGPWFVSGGVSFGWNEYSGTRHISFPGVDRRARAEYNGQSYTGLVTTGYHFSTRGFTITPLASLQYTHLQLDGYRETGAGDINLEVESQSYDFLESGLGVKLARAFGAGGGAFVPEIHFKWLHELDNPTLENTAAYTASGSSSFTTPGLKTADDTFNVGGGLTFLSCACSARTWALEGVYDYDWRSDGYAAHQGMMKFSSRF